MQNRALICYNIYYLKSYLLAVIIAFECNINHMRTLVLLLFTAIACIANAQQFKFLPKWQPGVAINMEYIYGDHEYKKDGEHKFDTVHADIRLKFIREDDNFYYFDWQFLSYYQDITDNSSTSKKVTGPVIAKFIMQTPINFKVDKEDWEIKVQNEEVIDSLKMIAIRETVAAMPPKPEKEEFMSAESVLDLSVSLEMAKKIYGLIDEYFAIYKNDKLVLNQKKDLAEEMSQDDKEDVSKLLGGNYGGYSLLDDKDALYYNYHTEIKMDMGKMMNMFAELAKEMDKGKKKKGKKNDEPELGGSAPINSFTSVDIKVSKTNMLVQSYTQIVTMDGKDTWIGTSGDALKILRVK